MKVGKVIDTRKPNARIQRKACRNERSRNTDQGIRHEATMGVTSELNDDAE